MYSTLVKLRKKYDTISEYVLLIVIFYNNNKYLYIYNIKYKKRKALSQKYIDKVKLNNLKSK